MYFWRIVSFSTVGILISLMSHNNTFATYSLAIGEVTIAHTIEAQIPTNAHKFTILAHLAEFYVPRLMCVCPYTRFVY